VKQQMGLQMFIVKMFMISNMDNRPIYIKRKEGGKKLAAKETERECVRDGELQKMEVASVVKTAVGETDHFGIS
jgi:hypothetical protein